MMADDVDNTIDIRSRIKQFSNGLDANSNVTGTSSKPNPVPRQKPRIPHKSNTLGNINPPKMQLQTILSTPTGSDIVDRRTDLAGKPQPSPRSPKSADSSSSPVLNKRLSEPPKSPTPKPKPLLPNTSNNQNRVKSNTPKDSSEVISSKPKPPLKPTSLKPNTVSSENAFSYNSNNTSQTQARSQSSSPSNVVKTENNPPKPPRGNMRQNRMNSYENHTVDSPLNISCPDFLKDDSLTDKLTIHSNSKNVSNKHARISNKPSDGHTERLHTLDGQMIMNQPVPVDSSSNTNTHTTSFRQCSAPAISNTLTKPQRPPPSIPNYIRAESENLHQRKDSDADDSDSYDYPYEQSFRRKGENVKLVQENTYDMPDTIAAVADSDTSSDGEAYQDPDEVEFKLPPPTISRKNLSDNLPDSDGEAYQDPDSFDFKIPAPKVQHHVKGKALPPTPKRITELTRVETQTSDSDQDDYEEPPEDARIPIVKSLDGNQTTDDSDDNYDIPDSLSPPPVPQHSHNKLQTSSSDDEEDNACPDYTDPELDLFKPPVALPNHNGRRTSYFTPTEYMPNIKSFMPNIDDEESSLYQDPEKAFDAEKPGTSAFDSSDEDIYGDEPLYQMYSAEKNEEYHRQSKKSGEDYEEYLGVGESGSLRLLWAHLPSVRDSGYLESLSAGERKRQEAMFEVITSEASYLKSLDILVNHFMMNRAFFPNPNLPCEDPDEEQLLDRHQYHFLFTGISAVKAASERFLKELRQRQLESVVITSISDIIKDYAENHFHCYVKYISNQIFQDRTLKGLLHSSPRFAEVLNELEKHKICQGLSMQSFLTLPMQRITRLPLLVDAIASKCEPGSEEYRKTDDALLSINRLVHEANEGARKMERTEEMYFIQKMLTFKTKPIPLISTSRWLVKKGNLMCLYEDGRFSRYRNQIRQIFKGKCKAIYIFLFTDLVLITKMKDEQRFKVIDHCQRSLFKVEVMSHVPDPEPPKVSTLNINPLRYAFTLVLLESSSGKTVDYHCFLSTETDKTRWMEAFNPKVSQPVTVEGESIYDEWDCPQNQVLFPYQAQQPDELTLVEGDIIHVLRKLPDGWAEGQRMRDEERGWFPLNHTDEIDSKHMRAKNLMQRYRLLTHSESIVNKILGNK